MRAIVLMCLLQAVFGQDQSKFNWNGPVNTQPTAAPNLDKLCSNDQAACGCCLMQKTMQRMELFFNMTTKEMSQQLMNSKMTLNNIKNNRSAFSVALNNEKTLTCFGPLAEDRRVPYKHVFLNLGDSYNAQTGIFTAPISGVYSLAVTVYSLSPLDLPQATCAQLQVNGVAVAPLIEKNGLDSEDSSTVVIARHLKAGDQVSVSLLKGCNICDDASHYNTFTGFLLYAAETA
ncbi:complement C1q-like protein 2 [Gambusia affinis]|uniref:complement C1q-like protein 2 n=1 Tax=Gambusia affinis TaxID=33528 RepID=UPI001CDD40E7|nr:complement C1q-like protein 2 [Gambusia affinis]